MKNGWMLAGLLLAALAVLQPRAASGHPLAPSLLDVRETGAGLLSIVWKTPLARMPGAELRPVLPPGCVLLGDPVESRVETALVTRWKTRCGFSSLVGKRIAVTGMDETRTNVLLRIALGDGRSVRAVLDDTDPSFVVPERQGPVEVGGRYLRLGVDHILTGPDHLLFVLGLLRLVTGGRRLFWTLTSFTLGHSVTLSLVVLGLVSVPQAAAETAIALTLFVLAVELTRGSDLPPSRMRRFPGAMAALFGLLHGLGFAGALTAIGLPAGDVPLALLSFNAGIELGQVLFVAVLLLFAAASRSVRLRVPALVPAYAIGSLSAFWFFERLGSALG